MKITVHGESNIYFSFHGNNFAKSRSKATMEITIQEEKISHFTFRGKKRADHESRKYPLPLSSFIQISLLLYTTNFKAEE